MRCEFSVVMLWFYHIDNAYVNSFLILQMTQFILDSTFVLQFTLLTNI